MEQCISLISLGVQDIAATSTAFYEALGWQRSMRQAEGVSFFQCGCMVFALWEVAWNPGFALDAAGAVTPPD